MFKKTISRSPFAIFGGIRAFSAINIAGLAMGMATCLIIMLYVHNDAQL